MIAAVLIASLTFVLTALLHLGVLHRVSRRLVVRKKPRLRNWVWTFGLIGFLHVFEAGFYALALKTGHGLGLGGFESAGGQAGWMDTYYFALVSYTSLGLGDIYPTGHLRLIAGIASLNGFLLISCSAALLFRMVSHSEDEPASMHTGSTRPPPSIPGRQRRKPST